MASGGAQRPAGKWPATVIAALCGIAVFAGQGWSKPGWLSRTTGEFEANSDTDPRFSVETVQPLLQSPDETYTFFTQGRAAYRDGDWTTNSGLGFRYLAPSQMWMFGVNGWYDRSYDEGHERWGAGAEIFGPHLTGRVNLYEATSGTKIISETATQRVEERAVDGYDVELEAPVPHLPWARFGVTYYEWDTEFIDDIDGLSLALKMDVTERARIELAWQDDDADEIVTASLRLRLGTPEHVEHTAVNHFRSDTAFVPRNVARHTLDRVERHHGIVTERRTVNTAGANAGTIGGVSIGRGT